MADVSLTLGATLESAGDLAAFCRWIHPKLRGALILYTGDRDLAQDLTQETLARVCLHWHKVRGMEAREAWAHKVAINLARSHFRRRAAEYRARERLGPARLAADAPSEALRSQVVDAVSGLARRQRTALILRYYVDLSVAETASVMQCPPSTVKTLTRRALAQLRGLLSDQTIKEESDV